MIAARACHRRTATRNPEDIAPLTDEAVARATAGNFMGAHLIDSYRAVCNEWPYALLPASHWTPVASDAPKLLRGSRRRPAAGTVAADRASDA